MNDLLQMIAAPLFILLLLSPFLIPAACVLAQLYLGRNDPRLLAILPLVSGALTLVPIPGHWALAHVFYTLDTIAALGGSLAGIVLCAIIYRKNRHKK